MAETDSQLLLSEVEGDLPRDQDIYFAGKLISQLQKELSQKKRHLVGIVTKWVIAFDYLKTREDHILSAKNPLQDELDHFHASVSVMKGLGAMLLRQLRHHHEIDIKALLGYSYEDLEASVYELEQIDHAHKAEFPKAKADVLASVFGE